MGQKLKILSLALLTTVVVGTASASLTSAAEFHSEVGHHTISGTGTGEDIIQVNPGFIKCKQTSYVGTGSTPTEATKNVISVYKECTAFGFVNTTIDVNGCSETFNANGSMSINCPEGKAITVTAFNCHVSIGSQEIASGVTYDNAGSGTSRDVTVTVNVSGLKYTQVSKSFPGCTNGTFTNGTLSTSSTMRATDTNGNAVGIWHS